MGVRKEVVLGEGAEGSGLQSQIRQSSFPEEILWEEEADVKREG